MGEEAESVELKDHQQWETGPSCSHSPQLMAQGSVLVGFSSLYPLEKQSSDVWVGTRLHFENLP